MLRIKKYIKALVLVCLFGILTISSTLSATTFDNSDFVSEISSEELAEQELQQKQADFEAYNSRIEQRDTFRNFASIKALTDAEFKAYKQSLYDEMVDNPQFSEDQKNDYYIAMFGEDGSSGIVDQINDFNNLLFEYNQDQSIIVDASSGADLMLALDAPSLNADNIEYIENLSAQISNFESGFEIIERSSATPEQIRQAENSNIIFTRLYEIKLKEFEYMSLPKVKLIKRITNNQVILNIGLMVAIIILFAVRFPIVKKQQEYAWNRFRPLSLLVIPAVALVVFGFFSYFFSMSAKQEATNYDIYMNGVQVTSSDRIPLNTDATYYIDMVSVGYENTMAATSVEVIVTSDSNFTSPSQELETISYGGLGVASFSSEAGSVIVLPVDEDDEFKYTTVNQVLLDSGFEAENSFEPDDLIFPNYIENQRNTYILPNSLVLIIPSLLFGTLYFMFLLMPNPMVKMYLNELYTINKFCGFLAYNMAYRSNARVLIEETLQSVDSSKFAEDFAIIFFEKDRAMIDKIQDISQIYSYKFFEMYLGIVNIIFDEGVSDSTLKSLTIIQQFGDEYYNQADMFFKSKKGAKGSLMMIILICMALPVMVKVNVGNLFLAYLNTATGYTFTIGSYLVWVGIICLINNMYKNNKIVRKEGRYV